MAERIVSKKYRILVDATNEEWDRISLWTKASDVENAAGLTLEETVGGIKGITTDTAVVEEGYAADATALAATVRDVQKLKDRMKMLSEVAFTNVEESHDFDGYLYKLSADVSKLGVDDTYSPSVMFDMAQIASNKYHSFCTIFNNKLVIYSKISDLITVPYVICTKVGE